MRIGLSFLLSIVFHVVALALPIFFYGTVDYELPISVVLVSLEDGPGEPAGGQGPGIGRKHIHPINRKRLRTSSEPGEKRENPFPATERIQVSNLADESVVNQSQAIDAGESMVSVSALPVGPSTLGTPDRGEDLGGVSAGGLPGGGRGSGGKNGYGGSGDGGSMAPFSRVNYAYHPKPEYPERARREGWEGTVLVRVLVDQKGRSKSMELSRSSGFEILDQAAIEAVKKWRFQPARSGESAVESWVRIPVVFRLADLKN